MQCVTDDKDADTHRRLQGRFQMNGKDDDGGDQCFAGKDDRFPAVCVPLLAVGLIEKPVTGNELRLASVSSVEWQPDSDPDDDAEQKEQTDDASNAHCQMSPLVTNQICVFCPDVLTDRLRGVLQVRVVWGEVGMGSLDLDAVDGSEEFSRKIDVGEVESDDADDDDISEESLSSFRIWQAGISRPHSEQIGHETGEQQHQQKGDQNDRWCAEMQPQGVGGR